jgi:hypothetical protein
MNNILNPRWILAGRHGDEILGILRGIDEEDKEERERVKQAKAAAKRHETANRQAERKRQQEAERERKRALREGEKVEKERRKLEEHAQKPKRTLRPALTGASVFNATPTHNQVRGFILFQIDSL